MHPTLGKVEGTLGKRVVQGVQRDRRFLRGSSHRNRLVPEQASEPPLSCPGWKGTGVTPVAQCAHAELRLGFGAPQPALGSALSLMLTLPSSARAWGPSCHASGGEGTQHERCWNAAVCRAREV